MVLSGKAQEMLKYAAMGEDFRRGRIDLYTQPSLVDCRYFVEVGNFNLLDTPTDYTGYQQYETAKDELVEHSYIRPSKDLQDAKAYRLTEEGALVAEYLPDPEAKA